MGSGITPLETLMTGFCAENNEETGRLSPYNRYQNSEEQKLEIGTKWNKMELAL